MTTTWNTTTGTSQTRESRQRSYQSHVQAGTLRDVVVCQGAVILEPDAENEKLSVYGVSCSNRLPEFVRKAFMPLVPVAE